MPKIRVLVADDHTIVRDGICALLEVTEDIEVVGRASNGMEALSLVEEKQPDVILMDIAMPVMNGLEATRHISKEFPRTKVLVLTQHEDKEYVFPVIEAGACGFISKVAASYELPLAIRLVHQGKSYLSPTIAKLIFEDYQARRDRLSHDPYEDLTAREREILKLVAEGYTTHQIADMLTVTPKTVEGHKTNVFSKLGLHNRIDLVKYAIRRGIITS